MLNAVVLTEPINSRMVGHSETIVEMNALPPDQWPYAHVVSFPKTDPLRYPLMRPTSLVDCAILISLAFPLQEL